MAYIILLMSVVYALIIKPAVQVTYAWMGFNRLTAEFYPVEVTLSLWIP